MPRRGIVLPHASRTSRNQRFQVVFRSLGACLRQGRHRHRRPERLRQEQRRRRHHVGAGRAERQEPARRARWRTSSSTAATPASRGGGRSAAAVQRRREDVSAGVREPARARGMARVTARQRRQWPRSNGNGHRRRSRRRPSSSRRLRRSSSRSRAKSKSTRRLYRSGESEYLIDGQVCRLRDVHDLLMDTGLGAKAYAIIEQGKIGMILSIAADRSASADRRSGRRHEVQVAPARGGAEARSRAAEPHAHRRHRVRSREAARHAEAAGGQGAPLSEAARRAAPLGEGAVRAQVPRSWPRRSSRLAARLADAREREVGGRRPRGRGRSPISSRLRIELAEAEARATAAREAAHARELAINRQQQQIAFDREQIADARDAHVERSPPSSRRSTPGASRRGDAARATRSRAPRPTRARPRGRLR